MVGTSHRRPCLEGRPREQEWAATRVLQEQPMATQALQEQPMAMQAGQGEVLPLGAALLFGAGFAGWP